MKEVLLLSVIIPTSNRPEMLAAVLDSLRTQVPVTFGWEIIVVDNGQGDAAERVVQEQQQAVPVPVQCVSEPRPGLHHARHRGAACAMGQYLSFLDDDVIAAPTWVAGVGRQSRGAVDAIAGRVLPRWDCPPPKWLVRMPTCLNNLSLLDHGARPGEIEAERAVGCNLTISKQALYELGGFHPDGFPPALIRYRGDGENGLMRKFAQRGLRCAYEPEALVWHCISATRVRLEYHIARAFNQGISRSYTQTRVAHGLYGGELSGRNERGSRLGSAALLLSTGGPIARRLRTLRATLFYRLYRERLTRLQAANRDGYAFHQREIRRDPDLLSYVLQDVYL